MKNYIMMYALAAFASISLTQAIKATEQPLSYGDLPTVRDLPVEGTINVQNKLKENIYATVATVNNNKMQSTKEIFLIEPGGESFDKFRFPVNSNGIVLVSKTEGSLEKVAGTGTSLTKLRTTRDVEFKAIPKGCPGTVYFKVHTGRVVGKLRIEVDKQTDGKCELSRASKAYEKYGRQAGNWLQGAETSAKKAAGFVKDQGQAAYGAASRAAGSAKRAVARGLERGGRAIREAGEGLRPQPVVF